MAAISTFTTRTGDNHIDGLLMGVKYQTSVLTYSFPDYSATPVLDGGETALATARATYQNAARQQLALFSSYINVTFMEVSGVGETGDLKFSESAEPMPDAAAYAYYPGGPGRVVVSPTYVVDGSGDFYNNYGWMTLLHELGHAMGLKHPHSTTGYPYNGTNNFPALDAAVDLTRYTVMSYNNDESVGPNYLFAQTLSVLDIQALQYLYGANTSWNAGDTTYTYNLDTTPYFETIWDGGGTDTLVLNSAADLDVNLTPGTVNGPAYDYVLGIAYGAWIENLTTGSGNDRLTGNSQANVLDGNTGKDTMIGGLGDDLYIINTLLDVVVEAANEGNDTVRTALAYTLGANLERLELTGASNIKGVGNERDNTLVGTSGRNTLDGGAGADTLEGGAGDDVYYVDHSADSVTEAWSAGQDRIYASVNYVLGANQEVLILTGEAGLAGTGNGLANSLIGNSGHNTLNGGAGQDTLRGGFGNDTYVVDRAADLIEEVADAGIDHVLSSVSYTLADNVESLELTGTAGISGMGNALSNRLTGNAGSNTLNGGFGADTLTGGGGSDTYYVDDAADRVMELGGGGTDTVFSSISLVLSTHVERLVLTGVTDINATGNSSWNRLTGNIGANVLHGGAGNDSLLGGLGNDTYVMKQGGGADNVTDVDNTAGNNDRLWFNDSRITHDRLWFSQVGDNLEILVIGGMDKVTVSGWFFAPDNQLEVIEAGDGLQLEGSEVEALVTAMAGLTPPPLGQTSLTVAQHAALDGVLAANWS